MENISPLFWNIKAYKIENMKKNEIIIFIFFSPFRCPPIKNMHNSQEKSLFLLTIFFDCCIIYDRDFIRRSNLE